jgi:hypothetical protein
VKLEVHPATEVRRFIEFAQAHHCRCRRYAAGHQVELAVPQARDPEEARRVAMEVVAAFSAEREQADVRVVDYD